jgi:hypothetical protein
MQIQGIFGKVNSYLDKRKEVKQQERQRDEQEDNESFRNDNRAFKQTAREEAIDIVKDKAREVIESNSPLGKKMEAINELYKNHNRPKLNQAMQELSDRRYLNLAQREKRFEKMNMIKKIIAEDRRNKALERNQKMEMVKDRNRKLELERKADMLLRKTRGEMKFR